MAEMNHIQMIVFDWAGTTTDYGGVAPSVVFDRVFQEEGICLTKEEINAPMGMEKKAHIRALLSSLSGGRQWKERYGTSWTEEDAERRMKNLKEFCIKWWQSTASLSPVWWIPSSSCGNRG